MNKYEVHYYSILYTNLSEFNSFVNNIILFLNDVLVDGSMTHMLVKVTLMGHIDHMHEHE